MFPLPEFLGAKTEKLESRFSIELRAQSWAEEVDNWSLIGWIRLTLKNNQIPIQLATIMNCCNWLDTRVQTVEREILLVLPQVRKWILDFSVDQLAQ